MTWQEYLREKQLLADRMQSARLQDSPAKRLFYYWSAKYPHWRVDHTVVRFLDELFESNDFRGIGILMGGSNNYLVREVAEAMRDEVALRLAVETKTLAPEEYREQWWARKST